MADSSPKTPGTTPKTPSDALASTGKSCKDFKPRSQSISLATAIEGTSIVRAFFQFIMEYNYSVPPDYVPDTGVFPFPNGGCQNYQKDVWCTLDPCDYGAQKPIVGTRAKCSFRFRVNSTGETYDRDCPDYVVEKGKYIVSCGWTLKPRGPELIAALRAGGDISEFIELLGTVGTSAFAAKKQG